MNYQNIYNRLIQRGQDRQKGKRRKDLIQIYGQLERHHIIPRSMNGTNISENLVYLTPEEHFVSHELLVKIYPKELGPLRALMILSGKNNRYRNNKLFGWARRRYAEMRKGNIPWNKGIPWSEETKDKIREKRKLQVITEETKLKISLAGLGENNHFFGKKHTKESKKKISLNNKSSKKIIIDGVNYLSYKKAGEHFNLHWETVKKRCKSTKWPEWRLL